MHTGVALYEEDVPLAKTVVIAEDVVNYYDGNMQPRFGVGWGGGGGGGGGLDLFFCVRYGSPSVI